MSEVNKFESAQDGFKKRLIASGIATEEELDNLLKESNAHKTGNLISTLAFSVFLSFVWLLFPSLQYLIIFALIFGVVHALSLVYTLATALAMTNEGSLALEQLVKKYILNGDGLKDNLKEALTDILKPTDSINPTPTKKLRKIKK